MTVPQRILNGSVRRLGLYALILGAILVSAEPTVVNPGFEMDIYVTYPGYATQNGGRISGWDVTGGAGINPLCAGADAKGDDSPFADNSAVPEGKQVLFIQNEGTVSQSIQGFVKGRRYRVSFRENGRAHNRSNTFAKLAVKLGDEIIVSPHLVQPVCGAGKQTLPYARVVSADFFPPSDGALQLVFETLNGGGVSVLIDDVHIDEVPADTPLGSIVYTAESAMLQGQMVISVSSGILGTIATPLTYSIPSAPANENYKQYTTAEVFCATADVQCNALPPYYVETYLLRSDAEPIRSVRWSEGRPDIVFDFLAGGRLVITRLDWPSSNAATLIRSIFGSGNASTEVPPEIESLSEPEAVGPMVGDLLTAFLRLAPGFRDADKIDRPVRRFGIKKRMTSIYCATFTPETMESIKLNVNGKRFTRDARKFSWRLSYCCPVLLPPDPDFSQICAKFYPEQSEEEAMAHLHDVLGDDLRKLGGEIVALPVSPAVHTDFFNREKNNGLEPPFGISEAGESWFDIKSGLALRVRGGIHGLAGEANLAKVTGGFAELLGLPRE